VAPVVSVKAPVNVHVISCMACAAEFNVDPGVVADAFACANVPLGFQAESVSIRIVTLSVGDPIFLSHNLIVVADIQFPIIIMDLAVLPVTSPNTGSVWII
jgi:hypothetical protein